MRRPSTTARLPRGIRLAALLAALLTGLLWVRASTEVLSLLVPLRTAPLPAPTSELERPLREAEQAFVAELDRTLGPVREVRALTLGALAVTCGLAFAAALGLVRPSGLPRAGFRQTLARMAVVTALLRAADGAQSLAVARGVAEPLRRLVEAQLELRFRAVEVTPAISPAELAAWAGRLSLAWEGLMTLVMAGGLLALGQYFGSARVREAVAVQDRLLQG